jgi:hypothetical protein
MTPDEIAAHNERLLVAFVDCKRAYQLLFNTPAGEAVLADMEWFWRARESCVAIKDGQIDVYRTFLLEGRHEVYLRIRDYLDLTPEQLLARNSRPAKGAYGHDTNDPSDPV